MLRALDDDIVAVAPIKYGGQGGRIQCASLVELEWVGLTGTLEGAPPTRGANVTSADAFIVGVTAAGKRRGYLFEWKHAERYPVGEDKGIGRAGDTRRARYGKLYAADDSPFSASAPLATMLYEPFYQLMRLGLLSAKMVRDGELGIDEARVVVACPSENAAYRGTVTSPELRTRFPNGSVESIIRGVASDPRTFRVVDQRLLAEGVRRGGGPAVADWYGYNSARYGW
jgi:hypothetical protein